MMIGKVYYQNSTLAEPTMAGVCRGGPVSLEMTIYRFLFIW